VTNLHCPGAIGCGSIYRLDAAKSYFCLAGDAFEIIDISDPWNPRVGSTFGLPACDVADCSARAFFADRSGQFVVLDAGDPLLRPYSRSCLGRSSPGLHLRLPDAEAIQASVLDVMSRRVCASVRRSSIPTETTVRPTRSGPDAPPHAFPGSCAGDHRNGRPERERALLADRRGPSGLLTMAAPRSSGRVSADTHPGLRHVPWAGRVGLEPVRRSLWKPIRLARSCERRRKSLCDRRQGQNTRNLCSPTQREPMCTPESVRGHIPVDAEKTRCSMASAWFGQARST